MKRPYTKWLEEDDNFVYENYKTIGKKKLAKMFNRTEVAILNRYHRTKAKRQEEIEEVKAICPKCGSGNLNDVLTYTKRRTLKGMFCKDCLTEFTKEGIEPPLWN